MSAPNRKPKYFMRDGDSLSKFLTLGAILRDDRARAIHHSVAWHLLDRWFEDHGNGWASVGYLENRTGLTRGSVATATADLCKWGYFSRVMGAGKRPTAYVPNWAVSRVLWLSEDSSVLWSPDVSSVLQSPDTSVLPRPDGKPGCILQPPDHPLLPNPLTSGVTVESSGAPGAGLSAAPGAEDFKGEITKAWPDEDGGDKLLMLELDNDPEKVISIIWESDFDLHAQETGQRELSKMLDVLAVEIVGLDFSPLLGARVAVHTFRPDDGSTARTFERLEAANDNNPALGEAAV